MGDRCHVITYPIDHFDIYREEDFEHAVDDMLAFIAGIV